LVKACRHQTRGAIIAQDDTPFAIDDERRIGFVMPNEAAERVADARHFQNVQRSFGIERRIAGGRQQFVARAQGDVEGVAEADDHIAARQRPARFDKTQMALRNLRGDREVELALASPHTPLAEADAKVIGCKRSSSPTFCHGRDPVGPLARGQLPLG
jgi:hypothetical protein